MTALSTPTILSKCGRDIEAAVYTARALGYRTLVLYGHSLGNIHVK